MSKYGDEIKSIRNHTLPRLYFDKAEEGFTLIETLMAIAIFSVGILAVASMQITAMMQSRSSSEITEATTLASNEIEELMLRPYDSSELDPASNPHQLTSGKYNVQWTVATANLNTDLTGAVESKTVSLTVNWTGANQHAVNYVFIKHNRDI